MKKIKRIATALTLAAAALTVVSCGKKEDSIYDLKPEYKNKLTEGKAVDSITVEFISSNSGSKEAVTINKSDDYNTLREKLIKINGCNGFIRNYSSKSFFLREKYTYDWTSNTKSNDSFCNWNSVCNSENNTTVYDNELFIGNTKYNEKTTTESNDEEKKIEKDNYSRLDAGTYYKADNLNFELASNYPSKSYKYNGTGGFMYAESSSDTNLYDIMDENQEVYLKYEAENTADLAKFINSSLSYSDDDFYVSYKPGLLVNFNTQYVTQASRSKGGVKADSRDARFTFFELFDYENIDDDFKSYYNFEADFKLTDKYIILTQKRSFLVDQYYDYFEGGNSSKEEIISLINENIDDINNSYYTYETWINYKDIDIEYNQNSSTYSYNNQLGYDYLNYYCKTYEYSKNNDDLEDYKEDYYFEVYNISIGDKEIQDKKTKFINSCKDDNYLDKYQFESIKK